MPLAALRAGVVVARTPFGAGIAALILTLLARLLARTESAWDLPEIHQAEDESCAPTWFVMGRAPHAAAFEAGLVPDWIFSSRNRGMRPNCAQPRPHGAPREARAPPASCPAPR
jgi:hypothetical protein